MLDPATQELWHLEEIETGFRLRIERTQRLGVVEMRLGCAGHMHLRVVMARGNLHRNGKGVKGLMRLGDIGKRDFQHVNMSVTAGRQGSKVYHRPVSSRSTVHVIGKRNVWDEPASDHGRFLCFSLRDTREDARNVMKQLLKFSQSMQLEADSLNMKSACHILQDVYASAATGTSS